MSGSDSNFANLSKSQFQSFLLLLFVSYNLVVYLLYLPLYLSTLSHIYKSQYASAWDNGIAVMDWQCIIV